MKTSDNLMPNGIPKWIRVYDDAKLFDRYTVVYTKKKFNGVFLYVGMSYNPTSYNGICQHGETEFQPVDRPTYGHLGKRISFEDLPIQCKDFIRNEYKELWNIA